MTKSRLGAALAAAMISVAPAHAVTLNPRGLGQVLLYPYYTINKQQATLISVVNTSDIGKMINVRFNEGYNGRPALAFNVFLSPHDVWAAAISESSNGGAILRTTDRTCTDVTIPEEGLAFQTSAFDGSAPGFPADSGPHDIARTREGSIEIVAAGDIVPGSLTDAAVTHVQTGNPGEGTPSDCASITAAQLAIDVVAPTAALSGSGSIVNVSEGTFFGYVADAITGFSDTPLVDEALDTTRGSLLDLANTSEAAPAIRAHVLPSDRAAIDVDYADSIDAVSAVLMMDSISNEYLLDASIGAATDWIVTFPTKRFYVDKLLYPNGATEPFAAPFESGRSGVRIDSRLSYDREEGTTIIAFCGVPPPTGCFPYPSDLNWETTAVNFGSHIVTTTTSAVLGSALVVSLAAFGTSGWFEMDLTAYENHVLASGSLATDGTPLTLTGLPVNGFMVYNVININAQPGRLANYSGLFAHRGHVACVGAACN